MYVCVYETWHICREYVSALLCIVNRHVSTQAFLCVQMCRGFPVQITCWKRTAHVLLCIYVCSCEFTYISTHVIVKHVHTSKCINVHGCFTNVSVSVHLCVQVCYT